MRTNKKEKVVLEVAEKEFMQKGFAGARIVEIAERAEVSQSMLNYYFKSKEMLFDRVMTEKIMQLKESVTVVFGMDGITVVEKIKEVVERHFEFLCDNPDLPRFVINELTVRPEYIKKIKDEGLPELKNVVQILQRDLDAATNEGETAQIDAATLMMDILSLNFFTFIALPIFDSVIEGFDREEYLRQRVQENVHLILKRIKPEIQ
ncbi:MAG: TetR/AcrR family transcriptional regulator [Bacteroidales bacterium]|nr:TetR/AcrR family transcriptional regulator [Bacteroidales bacterium]